MGEEIVTKEEALKIELPKDGNCYWDNFNGVVVIASTVNSLLKPWSSSQVQAWKVLNPHPPLNVVKAAIKARLNK